MIHTEFHRYRPLVPRKKILSASSIYEHYSHRCHVTSIMLINFHSLVLKKQIYRKKIKIAHWFLRKARFDFNM